jgi:hypothetical protein
MTHELRGATSVRGSGVAKYTEAGVYSLTLSSSVAGTPSSLVVDLSDGRLTREATLPPTSAPGLSSPLPHPLRG